MDQEEITILKVLDIAVRSRSITSRIDQLVSRVEQKLDERPDDVLAWESIPLDYYTSPLPETIRSSWVFILRSNTITGAERHPNSHQRMMSYRGHGDFQTRTAGDWQSTLLKSDHMLPIEQRWISIPPNVWHQGVVPGENWVVVSFHTAGENELIEERPATDAEDAVWRRKYAEDSGMREPSA